MKQPEAVSKVELVREIRRLGLWSDSVPGALDLAEHVHGDQRRAGGGPYLEEHVFPVTLSVARFLAGMRRQLAEEAVLVALLHDTIEDSTDVTAEGIQSRFGEAIATRVTTLTKPGKRPGQSAELTEEAETRYVAGVKSADFITRVIKVLDRLNNLASVHERDPERRRTYLQETRTHYLDLARSVDDSLAGLMTDLLGEQERHLERGISSSR